MARGSHHNQAFFLARDTIIGHVFNVSFSCSLINNTVLFAILFQFPSSASMLVYASLWKTHKDSFGLLLHKKKKNKAMCSQPVLQHAVHPRLKRRSGKIRFEDHVPPLHLENQFVDFYRDKQTNLECTSTRSSRNCARDIINPRMIRRHIREVILPSGWAVSV